MTAPREAVVLAAGRGSRLGELTDSRPKCLVEVGGRAILARLLGQLRDLEVDRAVVVAGYREELVRAALAAAPIAVEVAANRRYTETGTAHSLALGLERCRPGAVVALIEGDMVFADALLERVLSAAGTATAVDSESTEQGSRLAVAPDGCVSGWAHAGDAAGAAAGHKAVNLTVLAPAAQAELRRHAEQEAAADPGAAAERALQLLCRSRRVEAIDVCGMPWAEIDDAGDLAAAERLFPRPLAAS